MTAPYIAKFEFAARSCALLCALFLPISTSLTDLLFTLALILSVCAGRFRERIWKLSENPIAWACVLFYSLFIFGLFYTHAHAHEAIHQLIKFNWLIGIVLIMPLFNDVIWSHRLLNIFLTSACIILLLSYGKYFFIKHDIYAPTKTVLIFKDYMVQNLVFALSGLIFLYRYLRYKIFNRLYGVLSALFLFNVIFLGAARTIILLLPLLLAYLFIQLYKWKGIAWALLLFTTLCITIVFVPTTLHHRFKNITTNINHYKQGNYQTSVGFRIYTELSGFKLWLQKPVLGYGTGGIQAAYATLPPNEIKQTGPIDNASNEYLNFALQFGTMGLLMLFVWLGLLWYYSGKLPYSLQIPMRLLLIAVIISNVANSWLTDTTPSHLIALLTAGFLANIKMPLLSKKFTEVRLESTAPIPRSPDSV